MKIFCFILVLFCTLSCRDNLGPNDPLGLYFESSKFYGLGKLKDLSAKTGARVFWWNVAWGKYNSTHTIDKNLIELVRSNARPDVLLLGEFKATVLADDTKSFLNKYYPHRALIKYHADSGVGIGVYSTHQFSVQRVEKLEWSKSNSERNEWLRATPDESKHWDRSYTRLRWSKYGKSFSIIPIHLLMPWSAIGKRSGKAEVVKQFVFGTQNPLGTQINELRWKLKRDFGSSLDDEPFLMIGDFNVAKSVLMQTPILYSLLKRGLDSIVWGDPETFPTNAADEKDSPMFTLGGMTIDHAFVNDEVSDSWGNVLRLKGSDHYPMYVVIKP